MTFLDRRILLLWIFGEKKRRSEFALVQFFSFWTTKNISRGPFCVQNCRKKFFAVVVCRVGQTLTPPNKPNLTMGCDAFSTQKPKTENNFRRGKRRRIDTFLLERKSFNGNAFLKIAAALRFLVCDAALVGQQTGSLMIHSE